MPGKQYSASRGSNTDTGHSANTTAAVHSAFTTTKKEAAHTTTSTTSMTTALNPPRASDSQSRTTQSSIHRFLSNGTGHGVKRKVTQDILPVARSEATQELDRNRRRKRRIDSNTPVTCNLNSAVPSQARFEFDACTCIFRTRHGLRPDFAHRFTFEFFASEAVAATPTNTSTLSTKCVHNANTTTAVTTLDYDKRIVDS